MKKSAWQACLLKQAYSQTRKTLTKESVHVCVVSRPPARAWCKAGTGPNSLLVHVPCVGMCCVSCPTLRLSALWHLVRLCVCVRCVAVCTLYLDRRVYFLMMNCACTSGFSTPMYGKDR